MRGAQEVDVLVIGAGQAGLAMGHQLRSAGLSFLLLDKFDRIGETWRRRYDSLTLFSCRKMSSLPGMQMPGKPSGYPVKDEIAEYLENYVDRFDLPVRTGVEVERLVRDADGRFEGETDQGDVVQARAVVVATGAFQQPIVPESAERLDSSVRQFTPLDYQRPAQVPEGTVVIVGDGATGRQIARELAETHRVLLATGRKRNIYPQRILGIDYFWWLEKLGLLKAPRHSVLGRFMMKNDPFPGTGILFRDLRKKGVEIRKRFEDAAGRTVTFGDGRRDEIDAVIWSLGYREDNRWLHVAEALDEDGRIIEERGVTPVPGLYTIGRCWQWTRASATVTGVGADAAYIARQIRTFFAGREHAALHGPFARRKPVTPSTPPPPRMTEAAPPLR